MVTVVNLTKEKADKAVCRPTIYGNPFVLSPSGPYGFRVLTREDAILRFAEYFYSESRRDLRQRALLEIPDGSTIGCHCDPLPCHAHIIAGYLNWKRNYKWEGPKAVTKIYA